MDFTTFVLLLLILLLTFNLLSNSNFRRRRCRLPPGPYPLIAIGNFHQLGKNPHQSLAKLSKTYGPLMHLRLGSVDTIVVSSPEIAKEILLRHDGAFPERRIGAAARALRHHTKSLACLPVGAKWRSLRRICQERMFSAQRLDSGRLLRQEKLRKLVDHGRDCCRKKLVMDVGTAAFVTALNLISNTLFSMDFADYGSDSSQEFAESIRGLMRVLGKPNVADFFTILRTFDLQGIKRESEFYVGKLLGIFDGIIDRRLEMRRNSERGEAMDDMLEALLQINEEDQKNDEADDHLSRDDIKHLLLDLFVAGTDTSSSTVEWTMTELLRNPNIMCKAKLEIQTIIGQEKRFIEESDIPKLPYLQAIIKESFRYHPPGPFLVRTKGRDDHIEIKNYTIPKNALIFINIWAVGRDPIVWSNPNMFDPERFLHGKIIDVKGQNFELIPFGAGRRICPGMALAYRMIHLMVASLIHNFDWELEGGIEPEDVDISENFGLSLQKDLPLRAIPLHIR
ncbi:cytochrome P450 76T24-like [Andrographis paniculata]|uniref:cytochrome P450 76T24-like n=1 Tax=Andrographis paniculata TaxID=175694 RepID=UPI0021E7315D|nr:cytochrome P450 76T24-like [Andrographis paniculata]